MLVGLMVLQIQLDLLQFLLRCSTIVLHDFCLDAHENLDPKLTPQASSWMKYKVTEAQSLTADAS